MNALPAAPRRNNMAAGRLRLTGFFFRLAMRLINTAFRVVSAACKIVKADIEMFRKL